MTYAQSRRFHVLWHNCSYIFFFRPFYLFCWLSWKCCLLAFSGRRSPSLSILWPWNPPSILISAGENWKWDSLRLVCLKNCPSLACLYRSEYFQVGIRLCRWDCPVGWFWMHFELGAQTNQEQFDPAASMTQSDWLQTKPEAVLVFSIFCFSWLLCGKYAQNPGLWKTYQQREPFGCLGLRRSWAIWNWKTLSSAESDPWKSQSRCGS